MSSSPNSSSSSDQAVGAALVPLHDVVCTVDVILGGASMSVRDCLRLQPDSVVLLSQSAGADLQVVVNGITLARGEVMVVEDSTAVRITDITPPPSSELGS
jgi:flagellar motor switch protein FliN/FliY